MALKALLCQVQRPLCCKLSGRSTAARLLCPYTACLVPLALPHVSATVACKPWIYNSPALLPYWLIAAQVHGAADKVPNGALVFGVEGLYKVAKVKLQR